MSKIGFNINCPLSQYLINETSKAKIERKVAYAGTLLYLLNYPHFTQKLIITASTAKLIRNIVQDKQTNISSEAPVKCKNCPHLNNCDVGAIFIDTDLEAD